MPNDDDEKERVRQIVLKAQWTQAKRSLKIIFYLTLAFFAISGLFTVIRWFSF
ncbi:hypothetical protein [Ammoniphilus sp. 3BR4]|uniref:hypothetical protein n=1 Tax=Ammoniphilus sp. 3BR4 TaxID=3158265 RepID=UPI003465B90C